MTPSEKFLADLDAVCKKAKNFPVRRSDRELYGVLSACLHMVYRVDREGILEDLKTEVISRAKARGGKRPHFRGQTDAELVVGRLVFEAEKRRDATWRYTAVLREARKHQIQPPDLVSWLTHNGGVNALFRSRKVAKRTRETKTLFLLEPVELPKDGEFTLVLRDNGAGFYHVLGYAKK